MDDSLFWLGSSLIFGHTNRFCAEQHLIAGTAFRYDRTGTC